LEILKDEIPQDELPGLLINEGDMGKISRIRDKQEDGSLLVPLAADGSVLLMGGEGSGNYRFRILANHEYQSGKECSLAFLQSLRFARIRGTPNSDGTGGSSG
jgi:hypothetical protein